MDKDMADSVFELVKVLHGHETPKPLPDDAREVSFSAPVLEAIAAPAGVPVYLFDCGPGSRPIATAEQFAHFRPSLAVLTRDGRIMCYGAQVGTEADIHYIKEAN